MNHNLVFGGFYIHYKHDPNGELGNYWYQVLNLADAKDQQMTFVIYRPLYKSKVYKEGRKLDGKLLSDWMLPLPEEKITDSVKERYRLVEEGSDEYKLCLKLVVELYGEGNQAFYGENKPVILEDGSMKDQTFSKKKFDYPSPKKGTETYAEYRARVDALKDQGFHLGDLSQSDWVTYSKGSGQYEGYDGTETIS